MPRWESLNALAGFRRTVKRTVPALAVDGRFPRVTAAILLALLACLGGCGGSLEHADEFARYGAGAGELHEPFGIAADWRSGDLFVVDTNNSRVQKFTAGGRFLLGWGSGVADGRSRRPQQCTSRCFPGVQGHGAGQFQFPEGVAVDNAASGSTGDVYMVDIDNRRVQKFTSNGRFILMFGGGVNRTAHARHDRADEDVCPVHTGDVCGAGTEGSAPGRLQLTVEGCFIAVGPGGIVWLGQRNRVTAFSAAGRYLRQIELHPAPKTKGNEAGGVSGLAVNTAGDLYVIRHGISGVQEYTSAGTLLRTLEQGDEPAYDEGPTPTVAVDPKGDVFVDVYAHETHRIDEYAPSGARIASFDRGRKAPPQIADKEDGLPGMAYDPITRKLYLVNADINLRPRIARIRAVVPPRP